MTGVWRPLDYEIVHHDHMMHGMRMQHGAINSALASCVDSAAHQPHNTKL